MPDVAGPDRAQAFLLSLPDEILTSVVDAAAPRADPRHFDWDRERERRLELRKIRLVSRRLHAIVRSLLWDVVSIQHLDDALAVTAAIGRDKSLASRIRIMLVWTGRLYERTEAEMEQCAHWLDASVPRRRLSDRLNDGAPSRRRSARLRGRMRRRSDEPDDGEPSRRRSVRWAAARGDAGQGAGHALPMRRSVEWDRLVRSTAAEAEATLRLEVSSLLRRLPNLRMLSGTSVHVLGFDRPLFASSVVKLELSRATQFEVASLAGAHPAMTHLTIGAIDHVRPRQPVRLEHLTHLAFEMVGELARFAFEAPALRWLDVSWRQTYKPIPVKGSSFMPALEEIALAALACRHHAGHPEFAQADDNPEHRA